MKRKTKVERREKRAAEAKARAEDFRRAALDALDLGDPVGNLALRSAKYAGGGGIAGGAGSPGTGGGGIDGGGGWSSSPMLRPKAPAAFACSCSAKLMSPPDADCFADNASACA